MESISSLQKTLDEKLTTEEKISHCLAFMGKALTAGPTPSFKNFWECKAICLNLFKEKLAPKARTELWEEYSQLSKEVRRLKEEVSQRSAFAFEQMELAIQALEKEWEGLKESPTISSLSNMATRLQALRKEVLKTEMRIRHKNALFDRLKKLGDLVFPAKKALVDKASTEFIGEVEAFIQASRGRFVFEGIKEEIKNLQEKAKKLPLHAKALAKVRMLLSNAWDEIKKQEGSQRKREVVVEPMPQVFEEDVKGFVEGFEQADLEALKQKDALLKEKKVAVKALLEELRKKIGGSNLDMESAMRYQEMIERGKSRFKEIEELEELLEEALFAHGS